MTQFPDGQLLIREFSKISDAHLAASQIAGSAVKNPAFRLIEVSATAGGAWVCAWIPKEKSNVGEKSESDFSRAVEVKAFDVVEVDSEVMNAFQSLGPKLPAEAAAIGIVDEPSIAEVFRLASRLSEEGLVLLELRIKRSGPPGAYAYFSLTPAEIGKINREKNVTVVPLIGDYRRFF